MMLSSADRDSPLCMHVVHSTPQEKETLMSTIEPGAPVTRRRALALGAGIAGSLLASTTLTAKMASAQTADSVSTSSIPEDIVDQIEQIIQAQGMVSNGVLSIEIDRDTAADLLRIVALLDRRIERVHVDVEYPAEHHRHNANGKLPIANLLQNGTLLIRGPSKSTNNLTICI